MDIEINATTYNQFQDKIRRGAYQIFIWGWIADFPDPENFLFLLYGPQARSNGGSIILSTRHGSNDWHGSESYYYRGKNLNARNPLDNPEPDPKQPFSRQNGVATFGGPLRRDKLWFFTCYEYVDENASVAYSANSQSQFNALARLASDGLIPGVSSISVPPNVPVPFRDALFTARLDWAHSRALDERAPSHLTVPSGSRLAIDYDSGETPTLAVRLQEMFGAAATPRIAGGKVALRLQLLSPAGRPRCN